MNLRISLCNARHLNAILKISGSLFEKDATWETIDSFEILDAVM